MISERNQRLINLLQQRRLWAGLFAFIALMLPALGVNLSIDANSMTDAVMKLVEAISGLMAIILPVHSYLKPKE